jgi:hypothetical protein
VIVVSPHESSATEYTSNPADKLEVAHTFNTTDDADPDKPDTANRK